MAELNTENTNGRHSKQRAKKALIRLDMAPMVDLGFLLLTFFMLTATFSIPKIMELTMPAKGEPAPVKNAITVLLDGDKTYWYEGKFEGDATNLRTTDRTKGLRQLFLQHNNKKVTVIVKANQGTKYQNVIDVLDELKIANIQRYAFVDPDNQEIALLSSK
jgi:biopolymer transport protein ExbD